MNKQVHCWVSLSCLIFIPRFGEMTERLCQRHSLFFVSLGNGSYRAISTHCDLNTYVGHVQLVLLLVR